VTGKHSKVYQRMRERLIRNLAHCEAFIDFEADELSDSRLTDTFKEVSAEIEDICQEIEGYIA
jgi:tRNA U34 5-carboxymethylaminomethyl modifying GTPase MnmE/TrmE